MSRRFGRYVLSVPYFIAASGRVEHPLDRRCRLSAATPLGRLHVLRRWPISRRCRDRHRRHAQEHGCRQRPTSSTRFASRPLKRWSATSLSRRRCARFRCVAWKRDIAKAQTRQARSATRCRLLAGLQRIQYVFVYPEAARHRAGRLRRRLEGQRSRRRRRRRQLAGP